MKHRRREQSQSYNAFKAASRPKTTTTRTTCSHLISSPAGRRLSGSMHAGLIWWPDGEIASSSRRVVVVSGR